MQKNEKINILTLKFMPLMGNKSSGAIFGTFICRFHISTALSELNVPLYRYLVNVEAKAVALIDRAVANWAVRGGIFLSSGFRIPMKDSRGPRPFTPLVLER